MRGARPKFGRVLTPADHTKLWRLRRDGIVTPETPPDEIVRLLRLPRPCGPRARFAGMTDQERRKLVRKLGKNIRDITDEEIGSLKK